MLSKLKKTNGQGFTIIEVMIVLAIAGLILLIVFLAVPALQRNSRNTQRRSDASHLMGLVNEYATNHNGQPPTGFGSSAGQVDLANENFAVFNKPTAILADTGTWAAPSSPALDQAYVYTNTVCNNNAPSYNSSNRSIVVVFYVEPGAPSASTLQCVGT